MEGESLYPRIQEVKVGESEGHPWLHRKFETSQGSMTPRLKINQSNLLTLLCRTGEREDHASKTGTPGDVAEGKGRIMEVGKGGQVHNLHRWKRQGKCLAPHIFSFTRNRLFPKTVIKATF